MAKEEKQKLPRGSCPALTGALRYLKGLDEGPQQDADGVALAKQFDQPCRSEEAEEAQVDEVVLQRSSRCLDSLSKRADKLRPSYNPSPGPRDPQRKMVKRNEKEIIALA